MTDTVDTCTCSGCTILRAHSGMDAVRQEILKYQGVPITDALARLTAEATARASSRNKAPGTKPQPEFAAGGQSQVPSAQPVPAPPPMQPAPMATPPRPSPAGAMLPPSAKPLP
jgi:hypothetical protein